MSDAARPDGLTLDYAYDSAGRLSNLTIPRGATSGQFVYSYDANSGYLSSITAPNNVNLAYSYNKDLLTSSL